MKKLLLTLFCLFAMFTVKAQCDYTITGTDSYGDGWNGASVDINVAGVTTNFTFTSGTSASTTIASYTGDLVTFTFNQGNYGGYFDYEIGITILGPDGTSLYSAGAPSDGTVFLTDTSVSTCAPPSCSSPISLASSNITSTTADLAWTPGGTEASWDIEVVNLSLGETATGIPTTTNISTNPYTISGLTQNNDYEIYIRAVCGFADTSPWSTSLSLTTLCDPVTSFPWSEDFSDGAALSAAGFPFLPDCFTTIDNNGDGDILRGYSDVGSDGNWGVAFVTDYNEGDNDDYLVLPPFTLLENMTLSFQVKARSSSEPNDYEVLLSTTGIDPADFTEELLPLTVVSNTTYATQTVDLSAYSGDVHIAIHVPPGGLDGWLLYFDEFQVFETPAPPLCAVNLSPADGETDVAVSTTNNGTVNFTWDANPLGDTPTEYTFNFGTAPGSFVYSTTTSLNEINLSPLYPNETYYWQVVPNNAAGDATGCVTNEFQTEALLGVSCDDPITVSSLPYSETAATTSGFFDNYSGTPGSACTTSSYLNGDDIFYAYTASSNTYVTVDLTNITDTYTGVFIYENCSDIGTSCVAGDFNSNSTDDLKIENFAMVGGSTYYIVMSTWANPQNTTFDLSIKESVNWTGATSSDWAEATNWSSGAVPTSSDVAAIDGIFTNNPSISSTDAVAKTLIVGTASTLTIDETSSLTVSGDFTNNGTVTLNSTADDFSSLVVEGTATGDITYNRYVNVHNTDGGWDFVGSPTAMTIADFTTANAGDLQILGDDFALASYNNATGQWELYPTESPTGSFTAGQGYAMATAAGSTVAFTGAMQTTDQTINVVNNDALNGVGRRWNLVSNPFPSYMAGNPDAATAAGTAANFLIANATVINNEFLYVYGWDGSDYVIYNNLSGAFSMAPGQGFWVAAESTVATALNFTADMRTTTGTGDFVSGPQLLTHHVALKLFNGETERATTDFYFRDGLTLGLDPGYDAGAYNQSMALSTRLPQGSQETAFAMNAMDMDAMQNTRVPLEIRQNAGQTFRVSMADMNLPEDIYVYLEDTLNGTLTSLKDQDFELEAQSDLSGVDRFFIVFKSNSVLSNGDNLGLSALNVYKANNDSFVTIAGITPELEKLDVTIYSILGQTVREKSLYTTTATQRVSTQGLASGLYMVQIKSGNQTTVKKVIVK